MSRITKRRRLLFGAATVASCSMLSLSMTSKAPLILYPITPSLPPGLYVRTFEPPAVGLIAAFRVPEAAKRYKASIGEDAHDDFFFMKPIVAGPGDHVCRRPSDGVYLNGIRIAEEYIEKEVDRPLPRLRQICRQLADDEFFMLSTHVQNSFDSRHFGPIAVSGILGTYSFP